MEIRKDIFCDRIFFGKFDRISNQNGVFFGGYMICWIESNIRLFILDVIDCLKFFNIVLDSRFVFLVGLCFLWKLFLIIGMI